MMSSSVWTARVTRGKPTFSYADHQPNSHVTGVGIDHRNGCPSEKGRCQQQH
ncbi:hypothetical protein DPMN_108685 [Dreissena polymorpha]|uniref:Uncharacterized protein n=1 Tax=Dreissena polymorpha TaxID=45954 RepID=A0A9D4QLG1_DREPO|nr:hypothetical protein DPMN_108685 [Dreissena polymorpha]